MWFSTALVVAVLASLVSPGGAVCLGDRSEEFAECLETSFRNFRAGADFRPPALLCADSVDLACRSYVEYLACMGPYIANCTDKETLSHRTVVGSLQFLCSDMGRQAYLSQMDCWLKRQLRNRTDTACLPLMAREGVDACTRSNDYSLCVVDTIESVCNKEAADIMRFMLFQSSQPLHEAQGCTFPSALIPFTPPAQTGSMTSVDNQALLTSTSKNDVTYNWSGTTTTDVMKTASQESSSSSQMSSTQESNTSGGASTTAHVENSSSSGAETSPDRTTTGRDVTGNPALTTSEYQLGQEGSAGTQGMISSESTTGRETFSESTPGLDTSSNPSTGLDTSSLPSTSTDTSSGMTTGRETSSEPTTGIDTSSKPSTGLETSSLPSTSTDTSSGMITGLEIAGELTLSPDTSSRASAEVTTAGDISLSPETFPATAGSNIPTGETPESSTASKAVTVTTPTTSTEFFVTGSASDLDNVTLPEAATEASDEPSTGIDISSEPTSGIDTSSEPTSGIDTSSEPSTGIDTSSEPTTGIDTSTEPSTGIDTSSEPSTGIDTSSEPSTGIDTSSEPSTGIDTSSEPTTGIDTSTEPSTGIEITSEPSTGIYISSEPSTDLETSTEIPFTRETSTAATSHLFETSTAFGETSTESSTTSGDGLPELITSSGSLQTVTPMDISTETAWTSISETPWSSETTTDVVTTSTEAVEVFNATSTQSSSGDGGSSEATSHGEFSGEMSTTATKDATTEPERPSLMPSVAFAKCWADNSFVQSALECMRVPAYPDKCRALLEQTRCFVVAVENYCHPASYGPMTTFLLSLQQTGKEALGDRPCDVTFSLGAPTVAANTDATTTDATTATASTTPITMTTTPLTSTVWTTERPKTVGTTAAAPAKGPIRCFDCHSGYGTYQNRFCPNNGTLVKWGVAVISCTGPCFSRTDIYNPGNVFRGCYDLQRPWLNIRHPPRGGFHQVNGDQWFFCYKDDCNDNNMSRFAGKP